MSPSEHTVGRNVDIGCKKAIDVAVTAYFGATESTLAVHVTANHGAADHWYVDSTATHPIVYERYSQRIRADPMQEVCL